MKNVIFTPRHLASLITAGAVSAILASPAMAATENSAASAQAYDGMGKDVAWEQDFNTVDEDNDNGVQWTELESAYSDELNTVGWGEEEIFNRFDPNDDDVIDATEYIFLITGLEQNYLEESGQEMGLAVQRTQREQQANQQGQTQQAQQDQQVQAEEQDQQKAQVAQQPGSQQDQRAQQAQQNQQAQQGQQAQKQSQQPSAQQGQQADVNTALVTVAVVQEIPVGDLEGRQVVNLQGQEIGEVDDVVTDGNKAALVVSVGGFWGIGDKSVLVDLNQVNLSGDQIVWETAAEEEALEELPAYDDSNYVSIR